MYKTFDDSGLTALTNHMKTTKRTADESSSAVSELEGDFQELVQQFAVVATEVDTCLSELDALKANRADFGVYDATIE